MAKLLRFVRLDDSFDTQVFTFALPESLPCLESVPAPGATSGDFVSRDFNYGHQRWRVSFSTTNSHLGASLTLAHVTAGMTCVVDFNFTMVNREHFTKNDVYSERSCPFTVEYPVHSRRTFVALSDLRQRGFKQDNGQFIVELEMRNIKNAFEQVVQLPPEPRESTLNNNMRWPKVETSYFSFGGSDWNVTIFPGGDSPHTDGRSLVCLARQTSFDHLCRVRYRVVFGRRDRIFESDTIEQMFDISGNGAPYDINYNLYGVCSGKGKVLIRLELLSVATISEVELYPLNRDRNRAHLYDRENQAWLLETDVSMEKLKLRLCYTDVTNVPRKFTRFVCWSVAVVPPRNHRRPIKTAASPLAEYYMQTDTAADCYEVTTDISSGNITTGDGSLLESDGRLVVHLEWINSHLLYDEKYNRLDEVACRQKHQMMREIMALQAENYALEKQLHSYHLSMSRNNGAAVPRYPDDHVKGRYRP